MLVGIEPGTSQPRVRCSTILVLVWFRVRLFLFYFELSSFILSYLCHLFPCLIILPNYLWRERIHFMFFS